MAVPEIGDIHNDFVIEVLERNNDFVPKKYLR